MQGNNIFDFGFNGLKNGFKTNRRNANYSKGVRAIFSASRFALRKNTPRNKLDIYEAEKQKQNKGFAIGAGGGTHPGAGIPMACLSGKHAAEMILKDLSLT